MSVGRNFHTAEIPGLNSCFGEGYPGSTSSAGRAFRSRSRVSLCVLPSQSDTTWNGACAFPEKGEPCSIRYYFVQIERRSFYLILFEPEEVGASSIGQSMSRRRVIWMNCLF